MFTTTLNLQCRERDIGGKATNLVELLKIPGVVVPKGFCIRSNAFRHCVDSLILPAYVDEIRDIEGFSQETKERIIDLKIPCEIEDEIFQKLEEYREPLAVRSSATLEDSKKYSFAGQQDSFLNVAKEEAIFRVKECWASLYNPNALYYRQHMGIKELGAMSVIVQEMINSRISGVMMTANLSTRDRKTVTIEASYGLGSLIVSGEITPDLYVIDKETRGFKRRKIAKKKKMRVIRGREIVDIDISDQDIALKPCLTDEKVLELYDLGMKIESYYKHPQDIEFANDDKVNIVQTRPMQIDK